MAKTFTIPFTGDAGTALARARSVAQQYGGQLTGDATRGTFSGQGVKGRYEVTGNVIQMTIDEKPFVIPWPVLESQIKKFFQAET